QIILSNIAYGATRLGSDKRIELEAAESIQELEGGRKWKVRLKPDLRYANLAPVLPAEAVDSFNLLGSRSGGGENNFSVALSDAPSANGIELIFALNEPQADFPYRLAATPLVQPGVMKAFGD